MSFTVLIEVRPISELGGEICACAGVDVQAAGPAPFRERIGIDVRLHDNVPLSSEISDCIISFVKPIIECEFGEVIE